MSMTDSSAGSPAPAPATPIFLIPPPFFPHSSTDPDPNSNAGTSTAGPSTVPTEPSPISPELRARFIEEMQKRKPSEEDVLIWNKHAQDKLCAYCSKSGQPKCTPADGFKSVRCRTCNERRGTCSKVREEHHYRVKRLLKLDDAAFQALYDAVGPLSPTIFKRGGKSGGESVGGDADAASDASQLPVRLRKKPADGTATPEPVSSRRRKSKSKSHTRHEDDEIDELASDGLSDLSSLCDCDHEHKLARSVEEIKRLEAELAQAKAKAQVWQAAASVPPSSDAALLQNTQNELARLKSAKEEVDRKLNTTTQALEKVLGQVSPLTTEAVRLKKDNEELRKKLRELEGIKAKYLELATATTDAKGPHKDAVKDALAKAQEKAEKAQEHAARAENQAREAGARAEEMKTKNGQLSEALTRVKEALGRSEAECKELREVRVAQDERQRQSFRSGEGDEIQNQNDKLTAMLHLLKGQLSRATVTLKEANENLSQASHLRLRVECQQLKLANENLQKELVELKNKNQALAGDSEKEKSKGPEEDGAANNAEAERNGEDVIMNDAGHQQAGSGDGPSSTPSDGSTIPSQSPSQPPPSQTQSQLQSESPPEQEPESPIQPQSQTEPEPEPRPQSNEDKADSSSPNQPLPTPPPETSELSQLKSANSALKATIYELQSSKTRLQADVEALNEELSARLASFRTQTGELITLKTSHTELKIKLDRALNKVREQTRVSAEDDSEPGSISAPAFGAGDLRRKLKDAEAEVKSLGSDLRKLEKEKERWERQREKLEKDKEKDTQKLRDMKRSLEEIEIKYERAVRDIKDLRERAGDERRGGGRVSYSQYHTRHVGRRAADEEDEERNSPYSTSSSTQVQAQAQSSRHASDELEEATREIAKLKDDLEYAQNHRDFLSSRLKARDTEHAVSLQKDIVEHTNIHLLNRMVAQAKTDFASRRITRAQIVETCDTLSGQLLQIAARRLERLEGSDGERVGFNGIMDLMDTASTSGSRWQGPIVDSGSGSASTSRPTRRRDSVGGYGGEEDPGADSQDEDMSEPPPKRRRLPR
ncbi:hypothetical protein VKT23_008019 [Stygiomarasmius scandens]|uniref:Uncharacterized protein n=1 Tax=Marasmiellus scandens TaxID=2682957 RepID=A0ABR1JK96_9AGAR